MSAGYEELLPPRGVVAVLLVTARTLRNWTRQGDLVPVRLPTGQKRYRREDQAEVRRVRMRKPYTLTC